jgi:hypothetical protein
VGLGPHKSENPRGWSNNASTSIAGSKAAAGAGPSGQRWELIGEPAQGVKRGVTSRAHPNFNI